MNWRPMDIAPHDGTRILVSFPDQGTQGAAVVWFRQDSWVMAWVSDGLVTLQQEPTHWMPLPDSPEL